MSAPYRRQRQGTLCALRAATLEREHGTMRGDFAGEVICPATKGAPAKETQMSGNVVSI